MCSSGRGGWARVSQPKLNLLRDSARNEGAGSPVLGEVCVGDNLLYQLPGLTGEVSAWSLAAVGAIPLAVGGYGAPGAGGFSRLAASGCQGSRTEALSHGVLQQLLSSLTQRCK